MIRRQWYHKSSLAVVFTGVFLLSCLQAAAETAVSHGMIASSPRIRSYDQEVMARFDQAGGKTQSTLDEGLAEALTRYYDNQYGEAVQAFQGLPRDYLTAEFLYLFADASLKTRQYQTAVSAYRQLLSLDPELHPVRLDLAVAYFNQGDTEASRAELGRLDEDLLPDYLQNRLAELKAVMDDAPPEHEFQLYLSQNIQWDSNIGYSPDDDVVVAPNGDTYRFIGFQEKEDAWRSETLVRGYWDWTRFSDSGFEWKSRATLYNLEYFDSGRYDSFLWKLQSGPSWKMADFTISAPLTYGQRFLRDSRLYDYYGISPQVKYTVNRWFRVNGEFGYFKKDYADDEDDALDQYIRSYEIEPVFYYNRSWDYVSLSLTWEEDRADSARFSDDSFRISFSTSRQFRGDIRAYFRYSHRFQNYKEPFPGWTSDREDDEDSLYLSLTKEFSNGLFIDVNLYWANNDSNTDIFDYDRTVAGAGFGFRF